MELPQQSASELEMMLSFLKLLRPRSNGVPILFMNRRSHLRTSLWSFGDCFVLRILLGIAVETCSRILHREAEEVEDVLCAALQELPRLEARSRAGARINSDTRVDPIW